MMIPYLPVRQKFKWQQQEDNGYFAQELVEKSLDLHDRSRTYTTAQLAPIVADSNSNTKRPVMIGMAKGNDTHFVVAYAYSGELIYIKDPAFYNDPTLQDYMNQGSIIHRVYSYQY